MDKINLGVDKGFVEMERKDIAQRSREEQISRGLRTESTMCKISISRYLLPPQDCDSAKAVCEDSWKWWGNERNGKVFQILF